MRIKLLFVLFMILALVACAASSAQQARNKALVNAQGIAVNAGNAFAGMNKIIIGGFKVGFVESKNRESKRQDGSAVDLKGIDQKTMQAITDAAYRDFVAQLAQAGFEVVDRSMLLRSPDFAKVTKSMPPRRVAGGDYDVYSHNSIVYLAPAPIGELYFFSGEMTEKSTFDANNPTFAASMFSAKSHVPVISVTYLLDFVRENNQRGQYVSAASLQQQLALTVKSGSGVLLVGGQNGTSSSLSGSLRLKQPIHSPQSYGHARMTSSEGTRAAGMAADVAIVSLGLLGGGAGPIGAGEFLEFEVVADQTSYSAGARIVLKQSNSDIINKMRSLH